ncbi:fibrous sheath CABYR-binding protein-like isoform X2 [Heterodontus francisci]
MKCINVPKDLSFISKQTISMILKEREKEGWSLKLAPKLDDTASPTTQEPAIGPREDKSPQIIEAAPEEGSWEAMAPLMIEAAPEEGPSEDTAPLMIEAAPEEGPWEDTASVMIEATPEEGPSEDTAPLMIEAAPEQGPSEDTASLMIEAAPEQGPSEDTASLMIEAAPEQGPSEDTASLMIEAAPEEDLTMETAPTEEAIEQVQSPEELPVMDNEEETRNPAEQQAAVIIQSTYRGYSTRKKLKEESPSPTEADNDLFTEQYPGTDGSEYNSGEELTFAEDKNVSFGEATGISHEEPKSRLEGNVSAAKVDTAQVNICAAELGSLMEKVNFNMDVDICGSELQPDTKEDNKSEPDMTTETAGQNICGTELDQKDFFEATSHYVANVDICSTELESFATGKDTGDETNEGTEIDIEAHGELGDEVTEEAVHHYEVGVSGTEENTQDQVNESQKSTKDIKEEPKLMADTKDNDNPPTAENQDAEGDSSMIE